MGCGSSSNTNVEVSQPKFTVAKDYAEVDGKTSGEGVKTTKAWEATLTPSILQTKRQEFWQSFRGHNRSSCLYLRQAAEADAATAKLLLEMGGFSLENGTMEVCISPNGHRYELPPFILVDPIKFKDPNMPAVVKKPICEAVIELKLRTVFTVKENIVKISNSVTVKELKELYFSINKDIDGQDVRMFFGGKEMQENKSLMSYAIETGMVVLVYKKQNSNI
jgi:Ubiquitin family/Ubiquitin-binding domain